MTGSTHIAGGILAAEILLAVMRPELRESSQILLISGAALGSLVPDIDHATSKISNRNIKFKLFGVAAQNILGHRGLVHSPIVGSLFSMIVYLLASKAISAGNLPADVKMLLPLFFLLGYISHLVLDSLNPAGIEWLWPFRKKRYRMARIKPRSAKEWIILTGLVVADVAVAMEVLRLSINFNEFF